MEKVKKHKLLDQQKSLLYRN